MASISSAPSAMSTRAPSSIAINSVHTQQFELTSQQVAEVHDLLRKGRKIDAIKRLREITNLGLAEAKSAVEAME
jgi:ribosomal protein L7/L12